MRHNDFPRSAAAVQAELVQVLLDVLPLQDFGRKLSRQVLAQVFIWLTVMRATIASAPRRFALEVSDETLRQSLQQGFIPVPDLPLLIQRGLRPWVSHCKPQRRQRGFIIAIDLHHQPYYGRPATGIFRAQAKLGTKQFWSLASAAIVERGERLTVAIAPVTSNRMAEVLEALLPQIQRLGLKIRWLLLDRGFYGAAVIDWLQVRQLPFVMPMIRRGRLPRRTHPGTGTAPFFRRGRRGFTRYTWRERRHRGGVVQVQVALVPHPDRRRRPLVFAYSGRLCHLSFCRKLYRLRFGIETSYREAKQSRGWTTSRNERWRRLLQVLSFLVRNAWILANWSLGKPQHAVPRGLRLTYQLFLDGLRLNTPGGQNTQPADEQQHPP